MAEVKILALDPAAHTGYAHSDGHHGVWLLTRGSGEFDGRRLERLREHIFAAFRDWGFEAIAFEDASFGSPNPNVQAMHNELRGVIKLVAAELDLEILGPFHPTTIKKFATGSGRADKGQMIRAAETQLGIRVDDDNIADALFILELARHPKQWAESPKKVKRRIRTAARREPKLFS